MGEAQRMGQPLNEEMGVIRHDTVRKNVEFEFRRRRQKCAHDHIRYLGRSEPLES